MPVETPSSCNEPGDSGAAIAQLSMLLHLVSAKSLFLRPHFALP